MVAGDQDGRAICRAAQGGTPPREEEMSIAPQAAPQILIVDDDSSTRDLLDLVLGSEGYSTLVATSLDEAITLCKTRPVALVLTDLFGQRTAASLSALQPLREQVAPCPVGLV